MIEFADRLPPASKEAEQSVLGAILREPQLFDDVAQVLTAESFYFDHHKKIYAAITTLTGSGKPVDLVSMFEVLKSSGHLESVGGGAFLSELWESAGTGASAAYHAKIVRDKASMRNVIQLCNEVSRDAYAASGEECAQLVARFESQIFRAADGSDGYEPIRIDRAMAKVLENIDNRLTVGLVQHIPSGLQELDRIIGGFRGGDLIVVAARPSAGKSAAGLKYAIHSAKDQGLGTYVASLEMTATDWGARNLASDTEIPLSVILGGMSFSPEEIKKLAASVGNFAGVKCWIDDRSTHTVDTLAATMRRMVRKQKVGLAIVDYLQLITHKGNRQDSLDTQIGNTTGSLKRLAKELNIPVILLAQLNREVEKRGDGRPQLSDLRGSGNIEQDADVVILLHPQKGADGDDKPPIQEVKFIVAKQRNGPTTDAVVEFVRRYTRFQDSIPQF